ncbi:hypothetical protein HYT24_00065 [Candidatus Pacearchaeota archaeon]|nr:hypothetical protein [Candidatus Pacearchaeota archaeon]
MSENEPKDLARKLVDNVPQNVKIMHIVYGILPNCPFGKDNPAKVGAGIVYQVGNEEPDILALGTPGPLDAFTLKAGDPKEWNSVKRAESIAKEVSDYLFSERKVRLEPEYFNN